MNDKRSLEEKARDAEQLLKERIREAHEATASLNDTLKQVKNYGPELVRNLLEEIVRDEVKKMQRIVANQIDESSNAVIRRFDTLSAILLGEVGTRRDGDKLSIPEIVDQIVMQRDALAGKRGSTP